MAAPTRGCNFVFDEEKQLCKSFLHILHDPIVGIGQKNAKFWERVEAHYNHCHPHLGPERPARSLETSEVVGDKMGEY